MMWAIYSGETPFILGENLQDLTRTCDELNSKLDFEFTIKEWIVNG